ncbi:MAG: type II toxin-antitoxin system HicB family antitoxin [Thiothrix sp.]|nr:type II toxin-antitoxin system HicB family antitoxin [Thiothrix sp.]HPQ95467.1 type II toxin-antitoxin system HicB family antitoxin [Thiolinea sp.]
MKYPVVIHHDVGSAYGVTVTDIPGCFSAGETVDEALENTKVAIAGHLEILAEDGELAPAASAIQAHLNHPDYADGVWAYVEMDITPYLGKSEKVNVTLPAMLIRKIDDAVAAGKGKNRSAFLADSALRALG